MSFNSLRFLLASSTSLLLLFLVQRKITFHRKDLPGLFVMGLLGHTLYQYLFIEGTHITSAGNTFTGILLVIGSQGGLHFFSSKQILGDLLVVLAGFVMGMYTC